MHIYSIELLDYKGRTVSTKYSDFSSMKIDRLTNGIYFITIIHSGGIETLRLNKQ